MRARSGTQRLGTVIRMVTVLAVMSLLSACWLQVGAGAKNQRFSPLEDHITAENVATLAEVWAVDVAGSVSEPLVLGREVYISGWSDAYTAPVYVSAYNTATGYRVWNRDVSEPLDELRSHNPVAFVNDELWISYSGIAPPHFDVALVRLNRVDGSIVDREQEDLGTLTQTVTTTARSSDGVVAYLSSPNSGRLVVRDSEDLTEVWTADLESTQTTADIVIGHRKIYVSQGDSQLAAFDAAGCSNETCDSLWTYGSLENRGNGYPEISNLALGSKGRVILTTAAVSGSGIYPTQPHLHVVSGDNGELMWSADVMQARGLAVDENSVYVTTSEESTWDLPSDSDQLMAFALEGCGSQESCEPEWQADLPGTPTGLLVGGGVVYTSVDDTLYAFDADGCGASTCEPLASVPNVGTPRSLAGGKLYMTRPAAGSGTTLAALGV